MPMAPNRSGSAASMMQYTYLPRLVAMLSSGMERSSTSAPLPRLPRAATAILAWDAAPARPFPFERAAGALLFAAGFDRGLTARPRVLPVGFGMFPAPAVLPS